MLDCTGSLLARPHAIRNSTRSLQKINIDSIDTTWKSKYQSCSPQLWPFHAEIQTLIPPKYTNAALIKQMKAIPQYAAIVRHYPTIKGPITELVQRESNFFSEVCIKTEVHSTRSYHQIVGG
jgi:hypothetical protein